MANYSSITDVEKLNNQFPELANSISEIGLFAGCGNLNVTKEKYYKCATIGDCTPIAYEDPAIMSAFVGILKETIENGQDKDFQPFLRFSKELTGVKVLIYTAIGDQTLCEDTTAIIKPQIQNLSIDEYIAKIKEDITQSGAKIIIITDGANIISYSPREVFARLNKLAQDKELMFLIGANLTETTEQANIYIANLAHNLCTLREDFLKTSTEIEGEINHRLLRFGFGRPLSNVLTFEIDESGRIINNYDLNALLRFSDYGLKFLQHTKNQVKLIENYYGALGGNFEKSTCYSDICKAVKNGIVYRSGAKNETTINLVNEKATPNPYKSNDFAIKALAFKPEDREMKLLRHNKPLIKFGDFRVVTVGDEDTEITLAYNFIAKLADLVVGGAKKFSDFKLITTHRNTLILFIGKEVDAKKLKGYLMPKRNIDFDFVRVDENIKDNDFLHIYRACVNRKSRDFVFVLGIEKLNYDYYLIEELANQMAKTAKQMKFACIVQGGCEFSEISEKFSTETLWYLNRAYSNEYEIKRYFRNFPDIIYFEANISSWKFRSYFKGRWLGETSRHDKDIKKAFLIDMFYKYHDYYYTCKETRIECRYVRAAYDLGLLKIDNYKGRITKKTRFRFIRRM